MTEARSNDGSRRDALEIFVGEWVAQVVLPDAPPGRAVFEWALRGTVLIQRSDSPLPEFPDGFMIIAYDDEADRFTQHYFDSRGVVRIYQMTLSDGLWTLLRTEADFTPLEFAQRYQGRFSPDGNTIEGRWETSEDGGEHWQTDFPLTYTRIIAP
jgi:hypothetical protein